MKIFREPSPGAINAHWVIIRVEKYNDLVEYLEWRYLPYHTRLNFDWYFKYRAALLQVKHPYLDVNISWGIENVVPKNLKELQLKSRITARKRKLTEFTNKLQNAKDTWNELIPIEEHPYWCKVMNKLKSLQDDLDAAVNDLKLIEEDKK